MQTTLPNNSMSLSGTPTATPRPTQIRLEPDERWFYVGKTKSGKSHLARANLRVMAAAGWPIVIIEPDGLWMGKDGRPERSGPGTVDRPRLVTKYNPKLAVQWYIPEPGKADPGLLQICREVMKRGNCVIYFDELYGIVTANFAPDEFQILWTRGRKKNIAAWAAAQRPARIDERVMSQAENYAVFRMKTPDDRKKMAEYASSPQMRDIDLPLRYWWYYRDDMDRAQLMAPIPKEGWS